MRRPFLALAFTAALAAGWAHAQQFSTLEERMSAADFKGAGLDKLSDDELAQLNVWLQSDAERRDAVAPASASNDSRGLRMTRGASDDQPVQAFLVGPFNGFGEGTVFRLDNGQVWRSIDSDASLEGVRLENPAVSIRKRIFGTWWLKVEGYNTSAKVERVE